MQRDSLRIQAAPSVAALDATPFAERDQPQDMKHRHRQESSSDSSSNDLASNADMTGAWFKLRRPDPPVKSSQHSSAASEASISADGARMPVFVSGDYDSHAFAPATEREAAPTSALSDDEQDSRLRVAQGFYGVTPAASSSLASGQSPDSSSYHACVLVPTHVTCDGIRLEVVLSQMAEASVPGYLYTCS